MIEDLLRPVPAAGTPAFWTKKTSSRGGYLRFRSTGLDLNLRWSAAEMFNLPCDCFMKDGVCIRGRNQSQGRVGPNHIVKLIVVDVEWFGGQGLLSDPRPDEYLCFY